MCCLFQDAKRTRSANAFPVTPEMKEGIAKSQGEEEETKAICDEFKLDMDQREDAQEQFTGGNMMALLFLFPVLFCFASLLACL